MFISEEEQEVALEAKFEIKKGQFFSCMKCNFNILRSSDLKAEISLVSGGDKRFTYGIIYQQSD